ncbi:MAG: recombinase family protein [Clostridia bacterium]|nr:recombinase family protein [Clostridia bacterium]
MRTAAYCRVSTDSGDQMNSLENQTSFFREYIGNHPDWEFAGIYSDEGITGTSVAGRTQFSRMIDDAAEGKIDLILTKEVSRFARNTVDALNYTRRLRSLGVGVYFINDNINTLDGDGELRLSLMSMLAQEESRRTSARVRWGMRRRMEQGFVVSPPMLGYDSAGGVLTVNPEEAAIVRRIFDLYVRQNMGAKRIAQTLTAEHTPLCKRLKSWSPTAVMRILTNEKYAGDLIQQKTKVTDYLTHKSVGNEEDRIVFRDHHEPIVGHDIWNEAQRIRQSRGTEKTEHSAAVHTGRTWCSGKIECGICHGSCVTKTKKAQHDTVRIYRCRHTGLSGNGTDVCTNTTYIDERILCACMQFAVRKQSVSMEEIRCPLLGLLNGSAEHSRLRHEIGRLEKQTEEQSVKKKKMLELLLEDVIAKEDYRAAVQEADEELRELNQRILLLRRQETDADGASEHRNEIFDRIRTYLAQETVTKELYSELLKKIVIYDDAHVDIWLHGMSEPIAVSYQRKGRGSEYTVFCEEYDRSRKC